MLVMHTIFTTPLFSAICRGVIFGVRKPDCYAFEIQNALHYVLLHICFHSQHFVSLVFTLGDAVLFCLAIVLQLGVTVDTPA